MNESMGQLVVLLVFSAFVVFFLIKLFASPLQSILKFLFNSVGALEFMPQ